MKRLYTLFPGMIFLPLCFLFFFQQVKTQPIPVLGFTPVVSGLSSPVDVVAEPGTSRLFIVQQGGLIRIVDGSTILGTPFLNATSVLSTGGERGLLSMALHPEYLTNRYFFVYYTNTTGAITVARYRRDAVNPDIADPSSGTVLLTIDKPPGNPSNHNGGKLNFGPDGMLYFATGDGGSSNDPPNNAQSPTSLLGKMLRLNVDDFATPPFYTIPTDNPFFGASSSIRDEVFALGLRNPWRWSFDRNNNDIWIADVGQGVIEEVNHLSFASADDGINYGWRCNEGTDPTPGISCTPTGGTYAPPIFQYNHTLGRSITGGYVYHGTNPGNAAMSNYYICADYVSGNVWLVRPDGFSRRQSSLPGNISGFGEDNNGELLAVSLGSGNLYSVVVTSVLPVRLISFNGSAFTGYNELKWTTAFEENTQKFVIEYTTNGINFLVAGEEPAAFNGAGGSYSFRHFISNAGVIQYRLRMVDIDQSETYSAVISISSGNNKEFRISPTVITGNVLRMVAGQALEKIEIFNADGKLVHSKSTNGILGSVNIPLPSLQRGIYFVRLSGREFQKSERIYIE